MKNPTFNTKTLVKIGMLGAIAAVLMLFEFPLPFLAPSFYELDFSEIPVLIGAFSLGPLAGVIIEFLKILLNLLFNGTDTAFVGEIANFFIGCSFILPAAWIYQIKKTKKRALIGMIIGTLTLVITSCLINAYIMLPAYAAAFGLSQDVFIELGSLIHPQIDSLLPFVILCVAPFNLLKGILVSFCTFVLYKHLSPILKGDL